MRAGISSDDPPVYCSVKLKCEGVRLTASNWPWSRGYSGETICFDCATARRQAFEAEIIAQRTTVPED